MTTDAGAAVPTLEQFGARLALIRWHKGWNQKEAALACRLPHGSWREWELSGRMPRNLAETAQKISEATGVDDYWIMTGRVQNGGGDGLRTRRDSNPQPSDMESVRAAVRAAVDTRSGSVTLGRRADERTVTAA